MDITVRPLEERDLPACLRLLRGHLAYPTDELPVLLRAWRQLLRAEAMTTSVLESYSPDGPSTIRCFGASVFVTDKWMALMRRGERPCVTMRTIHQELAGPSPILRDRDLRKAGAGGVNILILHYGEAVERLPADERAALRFRMFQALVESHRGHRVKEVLQEFWDELDPEYIVNGWGLVRSDYSSFYAQRGESPPPLGRGPRLIGITRDEAQSNPGGLAAQLFVYTPARLSLTRAEQRMLRHAVRGDTDVELAEALGVALPTIKSCWRVIYNRLGRVAPDVLVPGQPVNSRRVARGPEKRRHLLEYLRRHPEELRAPARLSETARRGLRSGLP